MPLFRHGIRVALNNPLPVFSMERYAAHSFLCQLDMASLQIRDEVDICEPSKARNLPRQHSKYEYE